jgi:hypothetical protein
MKKTTTLFLTGAAIAIALSAIEFRTEFNRFMKSIDDTMGYDGSQSPEPLPSPTPIDPRGNFAVPDLNSPN